MGFQTTFEGKTLVVLVCLIIFHKELVLWVQCIFLWFEAWLGIVNLLKEIWRGVVTLRTPPGNYSFSFNFDYNPHLAIAAPPLPRAYYFR